MIIEKPISAERLKENRHSTRLHFADGSTDNFYIRGAISWPIVDRVVSDEGKQEGFAIVAGQHLRTGKIWIFEEHQFWSVKNWKNPDQTLKKREDGRGFYIGLKTFLEDNLIKYRCTDYYYGGQPREVCDRFMMQVYDSVKGISLIELLDVEAVGEGLFDAAARQERLAGDSRSVLSEHIKMAGFGQNGGTHAVKVLLTGMETYPWIDLEKRNWNR